MSDIEICHGARIGDGTIFVHGHGTVIGSGTRVGEHCRIYHQGTFAEGGDNAYPVLGNRVIVSSGAKILGGVVIGDDVTVGANAVVIADVPSGATAVGVPARILD